MPSPGNCNVPPTASTGMSPVSPRRSHGSPLRPLTSDNSGSDSASGSAMMASTSSSSSKPYAFPPPSPERRLTPAQHRASTGGALRTRRSSPILHEIQRPSRRLSSHQMLLLTPFGGPVPAEAMSSGGTMARGSSSMGGPAPRMSPMVSTSQGQGSSVGMGREVDTHQQQSAVTSSSSATSSSARPARFSTRHQSLMAPPVNPSPLSQPMATIPSGSESGGSSQTLSREQSQDEQDDELGPLDRAPPSSANVVPMTRSNSLPVLTLRELDALQDKDGELGIARGTHWAWVSNEDDGQDGSPVLPPMPRTTPPIRPFAFQDPFAAPGTAAIHATSTSPDYHYSPRAEPRRMSEAGPPSPWSANPDSRSRGASVITVTPAAHDTPKATALSPPSSSKSTFNSRASMSALEPDHMAQFASASASGSGSAGGVGGVMPVRPRILRYKTSPARFEGLGLNIVVKPQSASSVSGGGRRRSSQQQSDGASGSRRRSSQLSLEHQQDDERRRSSGGSHSSGEGGRKGTWALVDVVDTLSTTDLSLPSSSSSVSAHPSPRGSVYTIEHVASRLAAPGVGVTGNNKFSSLPSRKGKLPAFDTVAASDGFTIDPLAFPRRGSLAVLSQTALGPWATKEDLLGGGAGVPPKGNWQDRRGSWAEGWGKK